VPLKFSSPIWKNGLAMKKSKKSSNENIGVKSSFLT
jgi:hypothetical protein